MACGDVSRGAGPEGAERNPGVKSGAVPAGRAAGDALTFLGGGVWSTVLAASVVNNYGEDVPGYGLVQALDGAQ